MKSRKRIILGNKTLATYTQGGGHWSVFIQYLFGLKSLGHDVILLELLWSTGNKSKDEETINLFFDRLNEYGLKDNSILLVFEKGCEDQCLESASTYGRPMSEVKEIIKGSDLLWNFCASFLSSFLGGLLRLGVPAFT